MIEIADVFSSVYDAMDISQSKNLHNKNIHLKNAWDIANNSGFDLDKKAFHQDYLKLKNDFDESATKVLYGKKS